MPEARCKSTGVWVSADFGCRVGATVTVGVTVGVDVAASRVLVGSTATGRDGMAQETRSSARIGITICFIFTIHLQNKISQRVMSKNGSNVFSVDCAQLTGL